MDKIIKSQALEANLMQTKNVEYVIPDLHKWFLSVSEPYWGIHKRTKDFFDEFHHPYSNRKIVISLLVNFSISDFWIYRNIPEREKAVNVILDIFEELFKEELPVLLSEQLVFIYLDFFNMNYDIIVEYDSLSVRYLKILNDNFENKYFHYLSNIGYLKKILTKAANHNKIDKYAMNFMKRVIEKNISFWDSTTQIEKWYENNRDKMSDDYSGTIKSLGKDFFLSYYDSLDKATSWDELFEIVFTISDMLDAFRKIIDDFKKATEQFAYIFYLLHLPGLVFHRDYLLMDLNNAIKRISNELDEEQSIQSIDELYTLFADFKNSHTNIILDSILTLGKEILNTGNKNLISYFQTQTIKFGFINPGVAYITNDWELKVNPNHIKNIRVWLELIEYGPEMMKNLLSALIINLRIGGVFIFDTDLFQKDVTKLLNANISPNYKLVKQLMRIFPVYFNEIGAEGKLREVSTKIDEISKRNDKLIHFLRKQIHIEGNNSHIQITLKVIRFWYNLDKKSLNSILPQNVFDTINVDSIWVQGVHKVLHDICTQNQLSLEELIEKDKAGVKKLIAAMDYDHDVERVVLIIELYQLLKEKYSFEVNDIILLLKRYLFVAQNDINNLEHLLKEKNYIDALKQVFSIMVKLNQIIFDPAESEGWDTIEYKRHIAIGIPSMYGEYHEKKFDALGLTFRLEREASLLISEIIANTNIHYFTAKSLQDIYTVIQLLIEGLQLDGIYDQGFNSKLKMFQYSLTSRSFSIKQYINIFQFMEESMKEIINKYFITPYEEIFKVVIPQHYQQEKKIDSDKDIRKMVAQKSEVFYRELLSSAFLIQTLDNFIGDVLNNLRNLITNLSDSEIQSIMTYNQDLIISPLYKETPNIDNQVFLGSKAYYLKKLYLNHYPVPPGFVITSEVFRRVNSILKIPSLNAEVDALIKENVKQLEKISGLKYGNPKQPLLLSVRSGAAVSMPGAMNTLLNVGMNDEITEDLSKQSNFAWTSWDCYRRLLQSWGMSFGLDRNVFDQIMLDYKQQYNVNQKIDFSPQIMRDIAFSYKKMLTDNEIQFESDPFLQLKKAIISVFNSWYTTRAKVYREHMQIAEEWGTAVILQQMIFGNLHKDSGSGVLFTHDIKENNPGVNLCGDFSFLSQGEDIVSGLVSTLPLSENQRIKYYLNKPFSLESAFPKIFNKLKEIATELIEIHGFAHQEIEFTFEKSEPEDLFILQTRDMSAVKTEKMEVFATPEKNMKRVGCGIGIGNKVLNGLIIFDVDDLQVLKQKFPGKQAVLVRPDTVPDDIEMIFECEGLLTGKGGATSHAAVTAGTLGKTCVVNCDAMTVIENDKKCIINGNEFSLFDPIAIDGNNGIVYKGNYPVIIQEL